MNLSSHTTDQKEQHVFKIAVVQGKPFYGFSVEEVVFLKVFLLHPNSIARVCNLLRSAAIMQHRFECFEAHIPFLLQILIDYNLYGMGMVHLGSILFRLPLPEPSACNHITPESLSHGAQSSDSESVVTNNHVFNSSTVPHVLVSSLSRVCRSEIEADTCVNNILNTRSLSFAPLNSTSVITLVQSLGSLWAEEKERCVQQGLSHGHTIPQRILPHSRPPVCVNDDMKHRVKQMARLDEEVALQQQEKQKEFQRILKSQSQEPPRPLCFSRSQVHTSQYPGTPLSNNPYLQFDELVEHLAQMAGTESLSIEEGEDSAIPGELKDQTLSADVQPCFDEQIASQVVFEWLRQ